MSVFKFGSLLVLFVLALLPAACQAQNNYTITLTGLPGNTDGIKVYFAPNTAKITNYGAVNPAKQDFSQCVGDNVVTSLQLKLTKGTVTFTFTSSVALPDLKVDKVLYSAPKQNFQDAGRIGITIGPTPKGSP